MRFIRAVLYVLSQQNMDQKKTWSRKGRCPVCHVSGGSRHSKGCTFDYDLEADSKIIMIEDIGYYHPSNANWSYRTHIIIDKKGAKLYKETFGGDSRLRERLEKEGYKVERLYMGIGSNVEAKWKDVKNLPDIETYQAHKNY